MFSEGRALGVFENLLGASVRIPASDNEENALFLSFSWVVD